MGWAIFELGAVGFATRQKPYCVSIHELYRFHIHQDYGDIFRRFRTVFAPLLDPTSHLPRAPDHREARDHAVALVGDIDADQVAESAKARITTHQRPHLTAFENLKAVEVRPLLLPAPAAIATESDVEVEWNTHQPKLDGVEEKPFLQNCCSVLE